MVTEPAHNAATPSPPLTVLYDGACPLCRREIGVYRGLQPLRSDSPVCFADVSDVLQAQELEAVASAYKKIAGFSIEELNARPPILG